jgi:REP element-mobilizing transposase RayT
LGVRGAVNRSSYNPSRQHRRAVRLPGFDYAAAGAYFVTICAARHRRVFGRVVRCEMITNNYGDIAVAQWQRTATLRPGVALDEFIVMPNHFLAVVWIKNGQTDDDSRAQRRGRARHAPTTKRQFSKPIANALSTIVGAYKSAVTRHVNQYRATQGLAPVVVWQRNYYERVIREERELLAIRRYIVENPLHWERDEYFPRGNR